MCRQCNMTTDDLREAQLDVLFKRSQRKAFTSVNKIFSREKINFTQFSKISTLWLDSDSIPLLPPDSESSVKDKVDELSKNINNTQTGLFTFAGTDVIVKYVAVPLVPVNASCFDIPTRLKQTTGTAVSYTSSDIEHMIRDFTIKGCNFHLPNVDGINLLQHSLQPADTQSGVYKVRIFFNAKSPTNLNLEQNLGQYETDIAHINTSEPVFTYTDPQGNQTTFQERLKWSTRSYRKFKTIGVNGIAANLDIGSEILTEDYFYQCDPNTGILSFLEFPSPEINASFPPVAFFYRYEGRIGLQQGTETVEDIIQVSPQTNLNDTVQFLLDILQDQLKRHSRTLLEIENSTRTVTAGVQITGSEIANNLLHQDYKLTSYLELLLKRPEH